MFGGIISAEGRVISMGRNTLEIQTKLRGKLGDSISVNGTCLTVSRIRMKAGKQAGFRFDASGETLRLTTLGSLREGRSVNLEPALRAGDPLGGHIVTGHVDGRGKILRRSALPGDCVGLRVSFPPSLDGLIALKGSIAVDGVSLTVTGAGTAWFETVLIPHTLRATTLGTLGVGDAVNLEADPLARYCKSAAAALSRVRGGNR